MTIDKVNTLKNRDVLVESLRYPIALPKKTILSIDEDTAVIVEQDGYFKGRWFYPFKGGTTIPLNKVAPDLKGSFLFGKYKNVTMHFLNRKGFEVHKQVQAKSATGAICTFSGTIYFSVKKLDIRKLQKWIKDNNFKTNGTTLLSVSQMKNVVSNLLFEKGFQYIVGGKRVSTSNSTFKMDKLNSGYTFIEIADYIKSNCDRFGFECVCMVTPD